eukprot:CAMPEP_0173378212 /NCGR_PEP_ID=MMETSP1356-20130122/1407_1 /TAXON_ID=77927 ORGANISM="Hemiselmis virescens, Strain PCC157" /NCGR_SAMPLE_ID=MMETSP1356 /ASSEMBLY_ACC=CAM_ASM_000847 /LENGTH=432 /DNA_ID=CAMNT_0014331199 /DNA_START=11 /DNA_END=1309 /DNA_ORIENTATION=+
MSRRVVLLGALSLAITDAFAPGPSPGQLHVRSASRSSICSLSMQHRGSSHDKADADCLDNMGRRRVTLGGAALAAGAVLGGDSVGAKVLAENVASPVELGRISSDLPCAKVLTGMWQLSGAHGYKPDKAKAIDAMKVAVDAGFTTFDVADIYGESEPITNLFRGKYPELWDKSQFYTKWVPMPGPMPREVVEAAVNKRLKRMGTDKLDLLQFHWWDYGSKDQYLEAMGHMQDMVKEGKIKHLAVTNFDTANLKASRDAGIDLVSNQVQFSLIDQRPLQKMVPYCEKEGVKLLAYGTVCGGFLSDAYVGKAKLTKKDFDTASKGKYYNMIEMWGGWPLFQELLASLKKIGDKHGVSVTNVATRWVLEQPTVAGAIVGARLGLRPTTDHTDSNLKVFSFKLDDEDKASIAAVTSKSNDLMAVVGDCGDEYRNRA